MLLQHKNRYKKADHLRREKQVNVFLLILWVKSKKYIHIITQMSVTMQLMCSERFNLD